VNNLPKVVTQLLPRVVSLYRQKLLLAHLMGEHCFAGWRLSSSFSVVVCNAAGGRADRPLGAWTVCAPAAGRVCDTARRASTVTSR